MQSKVIVVYHKGCMDGIAAAWVVQKHFKERFDIDVELYPGVYQEPIEMSLFKDADVVCVDFSFSLPVMNVMLSLCHSFLWLDHHKTAIEALGDLQHPKLFNRCDITKSGCMLAWDYYYPGVTPPLAIVTGKQIGRAHV